MNRCNSHTLLRFFIGFIMIFAMGSCNVYEWYNDEPVPDSPQPEPEPETPAFILNLEFASDIPLYQEVAYSRSASDPHDVRYQIFVYQGSDAISSIATPIRSIVLTAPADGNLNRSVEIDLEEGDYSFLVWTDHVLSGTSNDRYYTTDDLKSITLADQNNHQGSNPYRDAFRGQTTARVDKINGGSATVSMVRPMARFEFITTDLDEFMARTAQEKGNGSRADKTDYTVTFVYTGFMPSTYDIYSDKPIDAWTGTQFNSSMETTDDGTRMGYDYVFVNGSESSVSVAMVVTDKQGNVVASTNSVDVPLVRSKLTVVKGEFMSSNSGSGVTINPGYDGEYNMEIK